MNIRRKILAALLEAKKDEPLSPGVDLQVLPDEESPFCRHVPEINAFAQNSPENLATTLIFVIATIMKAWPEVVDKFPYLMTYIVATDGIFPKTEIQKKYAKLQFQDDKMKTLLSLIFGKAGVPEAIHYIWKSRQRIFDQVNSLLDSFNNAQSYEDREKAAKDIYDALLPLPGLGLPKAGFATQLVIGKYGCVDSINLQLLPKDKKQQYTKLFTGEGFVSIEKNPGTEETLPSLKGSSKNKAQLYRDYINDLEDVLEVGKGNISKALWDAWCKLVGHKIVYPTGRFPVTGIYNLPGTEAPIVSSEYGREPSRQYILKHGTGAEPVSRQHKQLIAPGDDEYERLVRDPQIYKWFERELEKQKELQLREIIYKQILKLLKGRKDNTNKILKENNMSSKLKNIILEELLRVLKEGTFAGKKELDNDGDGVPKWADTDDNDPKVGSKSSKKKGGKVPPQLQKHIKSAKKEDELDETSMASGMGMGYAGKLGKREVEEEGGVIFEYLTEEEAKKKQPRLGKVTRNPAGSNKKFHVYVKCNGRVKKISFGDPGLSIKRDSAARRKNFRARHKCDKAEGKNRCTARYWSCYQWRAGKKVEGE